MSDFFNPMYLDWKIIWGRQRRWGIIFMLVHAIIISEAEEI
jgi:hypothetical protein